MMLFFLPPQMILKLYTAQLSSDFVFFCTPGILAPPRRNLGESSETVNFHMQKHILGQRTFLQYNVFSYPKSGVSIISTALRWLL